MEDQRLENCVSIPELYLTKHTEMKQSQLLYLLRYTKSTQSTLCYSVLISVHLIHESETGYLKGLSVIIDIDLSP